MKSAQNTMPIEFKKAIDVACAIKSEYFFMNGGCAVFAALLAEIAKAKGDTGTFHLLYQDFSDTIILKHVCFNHAESGEIYDIRGNNAVSSLTDPFVQSSRDAMEKAGMDEDYIQDALPAFVMEDIAIPTDKSITDFLKELTDYYKFRVSSRWIDKSYNDLRRSVLEAVGLWDSQTLAS